MIADLVSTIIPVHNRARLLMEAVASVVAQSHRPIEIIVVDDGSTDGCMVGLGSSDNRVRMVQDGRNLGLAARLNQGIDLARGKCLARMDQDDVARVERRGTGGKDRCQAADARNARGVQRVGQARSRVDRAQLHHRGIGAAQNVVEVPSGKALGHVEAVAQRIRRGQGRQQAGEEHVGVDAAGVALVGDPVEAEHAFVALGAAVADHDVVARLAVVVVVAAAAEDDVVAENAARLERIAHVALQQVGLVSAFDPVVAFVAEHRVGGIAAEDEVVVAAAETFFRVKAVRDEVLAGTA